MEAMPVRLASLGAHHGLGESDGFPGQPAGLGGAKINAALHSMHCVKEERSKPFPNGLPLACSAITKLLPYDLHVLPPCPASLPPPGLEEAGGSCALSEGLP